MKTENGDEDVFGRISENILSENENRKQPEIKTINFHFQLKT